MFDFFTYTVILFLTAIVELIIWKFDNIAQMINDKMIYNTRLH